MITCIITYGIDPNRPVLFDNYARDWGQCIPRCGAWHMVHQTSPDAVMAAIEAASG